MNELIRLVLVSIQGSVGDEIVCDLKTKEIKDGNRVQLQNIPVGFEIYNVEVQENAGGKFVRAAGQSAKLISLEGDMAQVELPSGEVRLVRTARE